MVITSMFSLLRVTVAAIAFSVQASAQVMTVEESVIVDYRPVVARVEAGDTATARSRLQGVVSKLLIDEGSVVKAGDLVALVTDATLDPQLAALDSGIAGMKSQVKQSEDDIARAEALAKQGFYPKARLESEQTALDVLRRSLASSQAQRRALAAQKAEGRILAPVDAKVTSVKVVVGSVVSAGDVIASFATLEGVVRLSLPERHVAEMAEGETVALRLPTRGGEVRTATIIKVYPELRDGAMIADATVQGGLEALVGERVDVLAPVGERRAMLVPADFVSTRYGVDFIRVKVGDRFVDAPVALSAPLPNDAGQYEVLSGLKSGDQLEKPE
jgi:RND family efflux transporter MFP subunit